MSPGLDRARASHAPATVGLSQYDNETQVTFDKTSRFAARGPYLADVKGVFDAGRRQNAASFLGDRL
jgi:hypothetical protein